MKMALPQVKSMHCDKKGTMNKAMDLQEMVQAVLKD